MSPCLSSSHIINTFHQFIGESYLAPESRLRFMGCAQGKGVQGIAYPLLVKATERAGRVEGSSMFLRSHAWQDGRERTGTVVRCQFCEGFSRTAAIQQISKYCYKTSEQDLLFNVKCIQGY